MTSRLIQQGLLSVLLAFSLPALSPAIASEPAVAAPAATSVAPATTATTGTAQPLFADTAIEARLTHLSRELRCVVCQNEALSESPAELATDMRQEIRGLMKAGKTDQEVIGFLVERYGDFVLFRPPFKPVTYLLWIGPFVFLGLGVLIWFMALRARRTFQGAPVNSAQLAAAARLLEEKP